MHKSEHAAGFEWKPEVGPEAEQAAHEATCPNCGTHNTPGAARCSHCGCPLPKSTGAEDAKAEDEKSVPIYARDPAVHSKDRTEPGPHIDAYGTGADGGIYRREIGPEDTIDGIKAKDWAAYVGRSPMYYLMQFFRMSLTKQKVAVSLSAFLFGPAYLLYRKMWKEGLLTAVLTVVLSLPSPHRHRGHLQPFPVRCHAAGLGSRCGRRLRDCRMDCQNPAGAVLGLSLPQPRQEKH